MSVYDILQSPYRLVHSYLYGPMSKMLTQNSHHGSAGDDNSGMRSQKASIKPSRHFGDWPNLGAVSASISIFVKSMFLT
jgi:hypothetical protein